MLGRVSAGSPVGMSPITGAAGNTRTPASVPATIAISGGGIRAAIDFGVKIIMPRHIAHRASAWKFGPAAIAGSAASFSTISPGGGVWPSP